MSPISRFLLILALTVAWSPSYLFIKYALVDLPPFTIVTLRVFFSALIFLGVLLIRRQFLPTTLRFWIHASAMAVLSSALPYSLFCYAEQSIDSALAAILTGVAPMCTAVLAHLFIPNDRLSVTKVAGIGLSFVGLLLLFGPNLVGGVSGTVSGMLCATCAALSYGTSHVYAKKFITGQAPFVAPTAQMIASSVLLIPLTFLVDSPLNLPMPSLSAMGGVAGLVVCCTLLAFTIYYRLLEHCGATAVSMVACFFPVCGMLLGFFFLDEALSPLSLVAAVIILVGMMLVNGLISIRARQEQAQIPSR